MVTSFEHELTLKLEDEASCSSILLPLTHTMSILQKDIKFFLAQVCKDVKIPVAKLAITLNYVMLLVPDNVNYLKAIFCRNTDLPTANLEKILTMYMYISPY